MTLSVGQSIAIIAVCAACTFLERWLPWLLFGRRAVPKVVEYLGIIVCGADTLIALMAGMAVMPACSRLRRGVQRRPQIVVASMQTVFTPTQAASAIYRLPVLPARADRGAHVVDLHARAVHGLRRG